MTTLRTMAVVAVLSLATTACAKAAGTGDGVSPAAIPHPTGADQVVLRVANEGGFVSPQILQLRFPQFSLFGDGTVVTVGPQIEIYPGRALPPVLSQRLTQDGVRAVLKAALEAGLGQQHPDLTNLGSVGVSDMATTVFTFKANGVTTTWKVYALVTGQPPNMSDAEYKLRRQLQALVTKLGTLEQWLPQSSITAAGPFDGAGARVYVSDYRPDPQLSEPAIAWPLSTPLAGFGTAAGAGSMGGGAKRCGSVTGRDWVAKLRPLVTKASQLTPWTSEGFRYDLAFRPLLPDENGC